MYHKIRLAHKPTYLIGKGLLVSLMLFFIDTSCLLVWIVVARRLRCFLGDSVSNLTLTNVTTIIFIKVLYIFVSEHIVICLQLKCVLTAIATVVGLIVLPPLVRQSFVVAFSIIWEQPDEGIFIAKYRSPSPGPDICAAVCGCGTYKECYCCHCITWCIVAFLWFDYWVTVIGSFWSYKQCLKCNLLRRRIVWKIF